MKQQVKNEQITFQDNKFKIDCMFLSCHVRVSE